MKVTNWHYVHPDVIRVLQEAIHSIDTVLDIGCGDKRYHPSISCAALVTVDGWAEFIPDYLLDLEQQKLPFEENIFDVLLLLDVIEHLSKECGILLLEQMKWITRRSIILLTPLFWDENKKATECKDSPYYNNVFNYHKSLWSKQEFTQEWVECDTVLKKDYYFGVWSKNGVAS